MKRNVSTVNALIVLILICSIFLLSGCGEKLTPTEELCNYISEEGTVDKNGDYRLPLGQFEHNKVTYTYDIVTNEKKSAIALSANGGIYSSTILIDLLEERVFFEGRKNKSIKLALEFDSLDKTNDLENAKALVMNFGSTLFEQLEDYDRYANVIIPFINAAETELSQITVSLSEIGLGIPKLD